MAANKSKAKGNRFEKEIVGAVELHEGMKAVRSWGSNGRAFGHHEEVDILINDEIKVQAKVRKALPKWIRPSENVDIQIIKEDRGKIYVVQELNDWILGIKEEFK
tara:strand:- start:411 stop:725 length:315 start_codon:yes stop_codon:yes gene_type:complete